MESRQEFKEKKLEAFKKVTAAVHKLLASHRPRSELVFDKKGAPDVEIDGPILVAREFIIRIAMDKPFLAATEGFLFSIASAASILNHRLRDLDFAVIIAVVQNRHRRKIFIAQER